MNETRCSRSSITRGCLYHKPLSPLPSSLVAFIHRLISKPKRRIHVHPPRCRSVERKTGREAGESLFAGAAGPRRGPWRAWGPSWQAAVQPPAGRRRTSGLYAISTFHGDELSLVPAKASAQTRSLSRLLCSRLIFHKHDTSHAPSPVREARHVPLCRAR